MAQYIDKDAVLAEIDRRIKAIPRGETDKRLKAVYGNEAFILNDLLSFINTIEVKEVDSELHGIEKEVAEGFVSRLNRKRVSIELRGEKKAAFENEFNTLWQTIDCLQFANVAKYIVKQLCLDFATWGAYNLKGIGQIDKDDKKEMDIKVKEVDLQSEIDRVWDNTSDNFLEDGWKEFEDIAKHFFELGMKTSNPLTWEDILIIHKCIKDAMNYHLYAFQSADGQQKVYEETLKRFKALKGE